MPHATPSPKPTSPPPTPTFPSARLINANYANPNPVPLRCSIILERRGEGARYTRRFATDNRHRYFIPSLLARINLRPFEVTTERKGRERRALISDDFSEEEGGEISLVELIERFRTIPPPPPPFSVFRIRPIISRDHIARERFETLTFVRGKEAGDGL